MSQAPLETINVSLAEIGTDSLHTLLYPRRSHLFCLPK